MSVNANRWRLSWLRMWGEIGQIGISVCPGCAASLDQNVASMADKDGRYWHDVCYNELRCGNCGRPKQRETDPPRCYQCIGYRDWRADWLYFWRRLAQTIRADVDVVIRGQWWRETSSDQQPWMIDMLYPIPTRSPRARIEPGELGRSMSMAARKAKAEEDRRYIAWRDDFGFAWRDIAAHHKLDYERRAQFWRVLADIGWLEVARRKWWRRMAATWAAIGRAYARQAKRLLNPSFQNMSDPTEKRFAQLEIDDRKPPVGDDFGVDDRTTKRFELLEI